MKRISTALSLALAVLIGVASTSAFAGGPYYRHGGYYGPRVGVYFGGFYGPGYPYYAPYAYGYGPGYYYPPAVVTVPSAPVTYIEQPQTHQSYQQAPQAAPEQSWWYYCADSNAYYPWAKDCASPWKRVAPVPSPQG